jgi:hypothetical protein
MYFNVDYNCFVITFTLKRRLFARKERLAKRNKATLISPTSPGLVSPGSEQSFTGLGQR